MVHSMVWESELPARMQKRVQKAARDFRVAGVTIYLLSFPGYRTSSNGKISACSARADSCFPPVYTNFQLFFECVC